MYERNAIVLERYFNKLFGYDEKNNLKDSYLKYSNLVDCSEKYNEATDSEDKIMQEYDEMANEIKSIQKNQELLSQKSIKLHQERDIIFQNIAEESKNIKKLFEDLDRNIDENNEKMKQNEQKFVNVIANFSEKSDVRNNLGKERKKVESDYSRALNEALEVHKNINKDKLQNAHNLIENSAEAEKELYEKIKKNGENEKVPFDNTVIKNAIKLEVNLQKKEIEILCNIYDKTSRLFLEIKNNSLKIERHKKQIKDAKAKLDFLAALKEYVVQFLDNERLAAVNGENEHKKQIKEACRNFEEDLVQINNMYELLLKEISSKANKKMYRELYNVQYLNDLENEAKKFEKEISKLNLFGTIIDPNHWRIDGMKKIYTVFYNNVTEAYGRDLSEFETKEEAKIDEVKDETVEVKNLIDVKPKEEEKESKQKEKTNIIAEDKKDKKDNIDQTKEVEKTDEDELDEKIDMILGFDKKDSKINSKNTDALKFEMQEKGQTNVNDDLDNDGFWDDEDWDDEDEDEDLEDLDEEEDSKIQKSDSEEDIWEDEEFEDEEFYDDDDDEEEDEEDDDDFYDDDDYDYDNEDFDDEHIDDDELDEEFFDEYDDDYDDDYDDYEEDEDEEDEHNKYRFKSNDKEEDNPWDDDESDMKNVNTKNNKKSSQNSNSGVTRAKKTKGKHNRDEEKPKGLLGKFIK